MPACVIEQIADETPEEFGVAFDLRGHTVEARAHTCRFFGRKTEQVDRCGGLRAWIGQIEAAR